MKPFTLAALFTLSFVPNSFAALSFGFPYGNTKVRGVNLGGWLVLESWITPSLFDATNNSRIIDEYTFGKYQSSKVASATLKKHWDTWITEKDFKDIAAAGLNHVRIPIGYWAFDISTGEPYVQGQLPYLNKAVDWAAKYNLKVIVDLHGAPGSQNGFDNSGQAKSTIDWHKVPKNVKRTNAIIKRIAVMYKDRTGVVSAITPLNESFYYDAYGAIRWPYGTSKQSEFAMIISDAFQPTSYWRNWMSYPKWEGVIMDTHIYQVFSNYENSLSWDQHIGAACAKANNMKSATLWQIVGEWSTAPTDCTNSRSFFSRGSGSRYEGTYPGSTRIGSCKGLTGSGATFSASYKAFLRKFWEAQVITYEKAQGWIMWTWKTEHADDWSYQAGLKYGWIPKNPTSYKYPKVCG
ncbi:glycoside hydrolase family 5 protein [Pholiota conissans]|uniref:Glycoside hydrolase family 5 protein n=1 Tax=Pholiota conissans TaxID=109636 RepID=A0A9P5Z106_9AGAR|nr:glycoside hydrolase family 5 protein [Pholiota conissans]